MTTQFMLLRSLSVTIIGLIAVLVASSAHAQSPVSADARWYYRLGGAAPLSPAPTVYRDVIEIDFGVALDFGKTCGSLDPTIAINGILDDIADGVDQFENAMVMAANNTIAALPSIILQRANPSLYRHFQNALAEAKLLVNLSVASCEKIVEDVSAGRNPFEDMVSIAKQGAWFDQIDLPGNDPVSAKEAADNAGGNFGVSWLGGMAGGSGQPPMRFIGDVVRAGYNTTLNRAPTAPGAPVIPPDDPTPRLVQLWATPEDAAKWAVDVLGDMVVTTSLSSSPQTMAGQGLVPLYEEELAVIRDRVADLVGGATPITVDNLQRVSSPGLIVSQPVIEAIQRSPELQERAIMSGRLAADVAMSRTVERALAIRRMILTGQKQPAVSEKQPVIEFHDDALRELQDDIQNFLYEYEIRGQILSDATNVILTRERDAYLDALQSSNPPNRDDDAVIAGQVSN